MCVHGGRVLVWVVCVRACHVCVGGFVCVCGLVGVGLCVCGLVCVLVAGVFGCWCRRVAIVRTQEDGCGVRVCPCMRVCVCE